MRRKVRLAVGFLTILLPIEVLGQFENFNGINFQGQLANNINGGLDMEILLFSSSSDTLWHEAHFGVLVSPENTYHIKLGEGDYLNGEFSTFSSINWLEVNNVKLNRIIPGVNYLLTEYNLQSLPFAQHSLYIQEVPLVSDLFEVSNDIPLNSAILRYDGSEYYFSNDILADTALFSFSTNESNYSDTSEFAWIINSNLDTALYAYFVDSTQYVDIVDATAMSDFANYADSASFSFKSTGNWSIEGNNGLGSLNFLGTSNLSNLIFKTNNISRLMLGDNFAVSNETNLEGFSINGDDGALFESAGSSVNLGLENSFMFFNGDKRAISMGDNQVEMGIDSIQGDYSFSFGKNSYASGTYSTVIGRACRTDSSGSNPDALSSIIIGNKCIGTGMAVAMGDSAIAGFYRNVAIGNHAVANSFSATTAIGTNVQASGATSWAGGYNLTANGNFSSVLGSYASTNNQAGSFVYGDNSSTSLVLNTAANQFMVRASGGIVIYSSSDLMTGVSVTPGGGGWAMISDRAKKSNIIKIDYQNLLSKVSELKVSKWVYKGGGEVHFGPMAQDFYSSFKVGEVKTHINMLDFDGVILGGASALNKRINLLLSPSKIKKFEEDLDKELEEFDEIEKKIKQLYEKLD